MSKQDEKQRVRRRLQEKAVELSATNRWEEALETNKQILGLGEDSETFNRIGKAYMEMGLYVQSHEAYSQTLRLNPTNSIARKNLARLDSLLSRGIETAAVRRNTHQQVDLRLFITETGRTALTTLVDLARTPAVDALVTGEKVELRVEGKTVFVLDADGNLIGRLEPKLGQRLADLISGGNRYIAAIAQADGRQVRLLIRETYQHPSQRGRISFPGKLSEGAAYVSSFRYDDFAEDLIDEEETTEESESLDEEYLGGDEEEELGLDEIEQDMGDDDDGMEE